MSNIYTILSSLFAISVLLMGCREEFVQGRRLYEAKCAGCHMHDGTGLSGITPPLTLGGYDYLNNLPCIILYGLYDTIQVDGVTYTDFMLGFPELTDVEVSNISNYIAFHFLHIEKPPFSPVKVHQVLDSCMKWGSPVPIDPKRDTVRMFQSI